MVVVKVVLKTPYLAIIEAWFANADSISSFT
jgi:hypothetical protein